MNAALERLFDYFGYVGTASIGAWSLAAVLALSYALRWRRSAVCFAALALAAAGLVTAEINSRNVGAIKIDFSGQLHAAKARAERETAAEAPVVEPDISEEAQQAKRAEAGRNEQDPENGQVEGAGPERAYHRGGKVEREAGKQSAVVIPTSFGKEEQPVVGKVRTMKMHEAAHAKRLDRVNLLTARWTLYLVVALVVVDYFRRFNSTFGCYLPLPFSGRLVDSLFPKSHTVCHAGRRRRWKRFLRRTVRKGETFILFSGRDPWRGRSLRRLPWYVPFGWRLEKVAVCSEELPFDVEFLFESAWFGRYCFVVVGEGPRGVELLDAMAEFLELRRTTRAAARRTVNVLWDLQSDVPHAVLDRLLPRCRETNFKLLVARAAPPDEALAGRFEEAYA